MAIFCSTSHVAAVLLYCAKLRSPSLLSSFGIGLPKSGSSSGVSIFASLGNVDIIANEPVATNKAKGAGNFF